VNLFAGIEDAMLCTFCGFTAENCEPDWFEIGMMSDCVCSSGCFCLERAELPADSTNLQIACPTK